MALLYQYKIIILTNKAKLPAYIVNKAIGGLFGGGRVVNSNSVKTQDNWLPENDIFTNTFYCSFRQKIVNANSVRVFNQIQQGLNRQTGIFSSWRYPKVKNVFYYDTVQDFETSNTTPTRTTRTTRTTNNNTPAYHKVVAGDTLSKISNRYDVSMATLKYLNPQIKDINNIRVGWIIKLKSSGIVNQASNVARQATNTIANTASNIDVNKVVKQIKDKAPSINTNGLPTGSFDAFTKALGASLGVSVPVVIALLIVLGVIVLKK